MVVGGGECQKQRLFSGRLEKLRGSHTHTRVLLEVSSEALVAPLGIVELTVVIIIPLHSG
jgi:hypothetical protein